MHVLCWHTKEQALKDFLKSLNAHNERDGVEGFRPQDVRLQPWNHDHHLILAKVADSEAVVGLLWDIKGMYFASVAVNEISDTPESSKTSLIRL